LIKEAGERLGERENTDSFYRPPDESVNDYRYILKTLTLDGLLDAFAALLHKVEKAAEPPVAKEIRKDRFTVAESMSHIRDSIAARRTMSFFDLFAHDFSRSEIITTFLALLELLKLQIIAAEQNGVYDDITITYKTLDETDNTSFEAVAEGDFGAENKPTDNE
jgi:segregation and condensation protein A